ncbi:MAG: helix-turn-helix transcriptional regulator [Alphaproteobacteria bacterium]|nr:helix-turn-helix transcriptional regulator [Alphaproteobacteria bacterium]
MQENSPEALAEITLKLIGDRWKVMILQNLMDGTKRFGELKTSLGNITQKVLTSNLRNMEKSGLLIRNVYAQIPPKVEYTLTSIGYSLEPIIEQMAAWGAEYKQNMKATLQQL